MSRMKRFLPGAMYLVLATGCLIYASAWALPSSPGGSGYHVLKTIHLPNTEGWDYISMDSGARRLYIGREKYMQVVDVDSGKLVATLTGMPGVHGIALIPELERGFTVNSDDQTSTILDLKTLKKIGTVKTGKDPDSYSYDESTKRLFIMNSAGNDATAINARDGTVAGTVLFDGQPEFTVTDGKGTVFVNITDKNQVLAFDARTLKVLHHWSLGPCEGPSGISMDREHRRLFSACDNQKMIVMDADNGRVIAALPTGAGTDASLFDPSTQNAFARRADAEP